MMSRKVNTVSSRAVLAGVLVLLSQAAWSGDGQAVTGTTEHVRVTLPKDWTTSVAPAVQRIDTQEQIETLSEELRKSAAQDLARPAEALDASRVELAIAEVPIRG